MLAFAVAVFTSAFLIFQAQPILGRFILPWYGGTPGVWTTCVLFFQTGLLLGYGYAHVLAHRVPLARQPLVHVALLLCALLTLPITPEGTFSTEAVAPTWEILGLLAASVGLPFVFLSASAPLLQHWFAHRYPGRTPFRLYALSNLGSLVALLGYPFVVEPTVSLSAQTALWSVGFTMFGSVIVLCAWPMLTHRIAPRPRAGDNLPLRMGDRATWTLLSACGSVVLLAVTNQMCQDVAVIPLLWVLPLSLYLATFIICFERDSWYLRSLWLPFMAITIAALVYLLQSDYGETEMSLVGQVGIYCAAMFGCCMVCHGELVRRRPDVGNLTTFYLHVALGGALGSLFVTVVAPLLFDGFWELHGGLVASAELGGLFVVVDKRLHSRVRSTFGAVWAVGMAALLWNLADHINLQREDALLNTRSFYGVLHVYEENVGTDAHWRTLYHGRISHGEQWLANKHRRKATAYFANNSGIGTAIQRHPKRTGKTAPDAAMRVGVVGLGVGTIATHGRAGDEFRFYELNPDVKSIALDYFTYLGDSRADTEVVIGDGRSSLIRELKTDGSQQFDVLAIDAFSGDAIPIHLLTLEAAELYFQHLRPDGILAIHITNFHLDLRHVVRQIAHELDRDAIFVASDTENWWDGSSEWVLLTNNRTFLGDRVVQRRTTAWTAPLHSAVWTDNFSNLLDAVRW